MEEIKDYTDKLEQLFTELHQHRAKRDTRKSDDVINEIYKVVGKFISFESWIKREPGAITAPARWAKREG